MGKGGRACQRERDEWESRYQWEFCTYVGYGGVPKTPGTWSAKFPDLLGYFYGCAAAAFERIANTLGRVRDQNNFYLILFPLTLSSSLVVSLRRQLCSPKGSHNLSYSLSLSSSSHKFSNHIPAFVFLFTLYLYHCLPYSSSCEKFQHQRDFGADNEETDRGGSINLQRVSIW